jgi:hypothetical protein
MKISFFLLEERRADKSVMPEIIFDHLHKNKGYFRGDIESNKRE